LLLTIVFDVLVYFLPDTSLSTIASKTDVPQPPSSVSVLWSSSACCDAAFAAALAADHNVDRLCDSGGCDPSLLLSLLLSSGNAAAALAANRNVDRLVNYGGSGGCDSTLLLLLLSSSGNVTAFLCLCGGCRHLRLWLNGFLFRFNVPVLRGLLKRLVSIGKVALSESVPYFSILERHTCLDHVDCSHCIGFGLLLLKTYLT
jgi:hypothetical protein